MATGFQVVHSKKASCHLNLSISSWIKKRDSSLCPLRVLVNKVNRSKKMSHCEFVHPDRIRILFSDAMSAMFKAEVPQYGHLLDIVADMNAEVFYEDQTLTAHMRTNGELERFDVERHGAIRVGTGKELSLLRQLFAIMGMSPVGYYDLSVAGLPVHSTAFRPKSEASLRHNPFRVFTSLLRLDLIADDMLREQARTILEQRAIFTSQCLALIDKAVHDGGLNEMDAIDLVNQALETFRWHQTATVDLPTYKKLNAAHPLVADVVCFKGPHINHLTPRVLDIEKTHQEMIRRGIKTKTSIEGPPSRKVPILLRQTSFLALEELIQFKDQNTLSASHKARFGEIEQRGCALTPRGRALYDRLLQSSFAGIEITQAFTEFPDDIQTLHHSKLAYFSYSVNEDKAKAEVPPVDADVDELVDQEWLRITPSVYEDFLPVSAAGIFRSNLNGEIKNDYAGRGNRSEFEKALGTGVADEFELYQLAQDASLALALARIGAIRQFHIRAN
jgi:uncharacterized glyoxalase superfamily metalloenzyme YdcJ